MFHGPNTNRYQEQTYKFEYRSSNGIATLNLPINTTLFTAGVLASNAAFDSLTSVQLGINRIYVKLIIKYRKI
jgi:hypothetical protein